MTTLTTETTLPPNEWWTAAEYVSGFLDLPGQSSLSPADRKILEEIASAADLGKLEISAMPKAAMEAVKVLRSPEPEIEDVARSIELDQGLAVMLLKHANSALYAPRMPIDNVRRAIMQVGMRQIRMIVHEIAMRRVTGDIKAKPFAAMEWRYAIHCAVIAKALAKRAGVDQELGYLAGLLHDVGRLPVLQALDQRRALTEVPVRGAAPEVIMEALHRGVGQQVAKKWDLPPAIVDAVASHLNGRRADEDSAAEFPTTKIAEAASDICHALGLGRFKRPHAVLDARSLRDLGLPKEALIEFFRRDLPQAIEQAVTLT
jgi:putative nucleotidyltransferase with HDIG domain